MQFSFAPPKSTHRLAHLSLVLNFRVQLTGSPDEDDAEVDDGSPCVALKRGIPAALVLPRWPIGRHHRIAGNTAVTVAGTLHYHQTTTIHFPPSWFVGSVRRIWPQLADESWQLVPANSTDALDYEPQTMLRRLRDTVAHMEFRADDGYEGGVREVRPSGPSQLHGLIVLTVLVRVADAEVRHAMNGWQQLLSVWPQYMAVLVVVWLAAGRLLAMVFRHRWVRSWSVVPWSSNNEQLH